MRILIYLHALSLGGVERVALRLCRSWAAQGEQAILMLGRHSGALPDLPANVKVIVCAKESATIAAVEDIWMAALLPSVVGRLQPDVIFCAGNTYAFAALIAKLMLRKACPPIVVKISNDLERTDLPIGARRAYHLWCRLQGRVFDKFVAIAPAMQSEIHRHVAPNRPVRVIPDAVLPSIASDCPVQAGKRDGQIGRRFVAIGRLDTQKNLSLLLDAFALGAADVDTLAIVGQGRLRSRLERQAADLGIGGRVRFEGGTNDVARWLRSADALLLTSRYEGMPAVVVEALAHGVPVITTDCCASLRAMFKDGRCGVLVGATDAWSFAKAIANFEGHRHDRAAMSALAESFSVPVAARRYRDVFADLADARRRGSLAPVRAIFTRRGLPAS